jgi:hypothetical protein
MERVSAIPKLTDLELLNYCQKDGMRITTVRDTSLFQPYPFQLPLAGGIESIHFSWSTWRMASITSLTLNYLAFDVDSDIRIPNRDLCAILSRNTGTLEHLKIIDHALIIAMPEYPFVVTLPQLKSLSIGYARAAYLVPLVEALHLPALHALSIREVSRALSTFGVSITTLVTWKAG